MMRTIGAISDTHGLLRPQALAALAGCDPIIHAGDVGSPDVLARLGALAPVHAVRGNVDHGAWSAKLPVTDRDRWLLHLRPERGRQRVHSRMTATPHLFGFDMICECDGLAEADEHVRTARRYIYEQERLIERLADDRQNTDDAFGLLSLLNRSLRLFERYRVFLDRVSSLQR